MIGRTGPTRGQVRELTPALQANVDSCMTNPEGGEFNVDLLIERTILDDASEATALALWGDVVRDAIGPMVDASRLVLVMSGTLKRHKGGRVPFVEYDANRVAIRDIDYSRREALEEQAIIATDFRLFDGEAVYHHLGRRHERRLSEPTNERQQKYALRTCLDDTGYRDRMALAALREWMVYRDTVYPSRAIVVCDSQAAAKHMAKVIVRELRVPVALAISDLRDSAKVIENFRKRREGDVLVTVGMAYEGLDVPDCTHLVFLRALRAEGWLEQAFARVTRINPKCSLPAHKQRATVTVPDDPKMRAFVDEILDEQDLTFKEREDGSTRAPVQRRSTFSPESAELGSSQIQDEHGQRFEAELIDRLVELVPSTLQLPPHDRLKIALGMFGRAA